MKNYYSVSAEVLSEELADSSVSNLHLNIVVEAESKDEAVQEVLNRLKPEIEHLIYKSDDSGFEVNKDGYYVDMLRPEDA